MNSTCYSICNIDFFFFAYFLKSFDFIVFAVKLAVTTRELSVYKHVLGWWTDLQFQFLSNKTFQNFWDDK